jgi:hypothetical protein
VRSPRLHFFASVLGLALRNTLEALVGAYALRSLAGFDRELDRLRDSAISTAISWSRRRC